MNVKVRLGDRLFEVEIVDVHARPILARVEGETFEVWPEDLPANGDALGAVTESAPAPIPTPSVTPSSDNSHTAITAPIPGVITALSVQPGASVRAGQEVCVLEAMKMKSPIRAPRAGTIKAVRVAVGQQVKHKEALMEYEA
jgi:biotin carboxyl carrier protein